MNTGDHKGSPLHRRWGRAVGDEWDWESVVYALWRIAVTTDQEDPNGDERGTTRRVVGEAIRNLASPEAIAAAGEKIYAAGYRKEYERLYKGEFVAVDVSDGAAYRGGSLRMLK